MTKIALIGAGGVSFAQTLVKDILLDPELRRAEVALMDIHAGRLDAARRVAESMAAKLGVPFRPRVTTDLRAAVAGARYVLTIFRTGTLDQQRLEYEIPARRGVRQVVADTLGPGGVFRGLRTLPPLFEVLEAMETHCPGAYLFNYVNPMSMNTLALARRARTVKVFGLCHSVQGTARDIAAWLDIPFENLRYTAAGVNHQAFMLKLEADGRDRYPDLRRCLDRPDIYRTEKVRFELLRHFGYFPTESSGHGSEYVPYFRKRDDLLERFCSVTAPAKPDDEVEWAAVSAGVSGAALTTCRLAQEKNERTVKAWLDGTRTPPMEPSHEYGVALVRALETGVPMSANLNVPNRGLIPSLPPGACAEVPCLVDGGGIHPARVDGYPEQLAALNRAMANVHMLAADGALAADRDAVFHAVAADPLTAAVLGLDEIRAMTDELFEALGDSIDPAFARAKNVLG